MKAMLSVRYWEGDTTLQFRRDVLLPFFNQYLLDNAPAADTPPVLIYNTAKTIGTVSRRGP
jgi:uncharacterized protein